MDVTRGAGVDPRALNHALGPTTILCSADARLWATGKGVKGASGAARQAVLHLSPRGSCETAGGRADSIAGSLLCPSLLCRLLSGWVGNTGFCDLGCVRGWDSKRKDTHCPALKWLTV